jgi:tRNA pseudouridine38-40 synthase
MNQQENSHSITRNFFMEVSFDGTDYLGWQSQPHGNTVQQALEKTLTKLFANQTIKVHSSGRTDAGVHALGMGVTFETPGSPYIPDDKIMSALNNLLPSTIRIQSIRYAEKAFHARFSALGKAYTYIINTGAETPFNARYCWKRRQFKHIDDLCKAARILEGEHDFSAFTVRRKHYDSAVRKIYKIDIREFDNLLCITFIGNGFLYKMVRSMVGALEKVGTGRIKPDDIQRILDSKDRAQSEPTCPGHGLFLMKVFYEENEWQEFSLVKPPFYM